MDNSIVTLPALDKLVQKKAVSSLASTWFKNAINPFPDYGTEAAGIPSKSTTQSIVKKVQKTISIQVPPFASTSPFDVFVCLMPFDAAASTATLTPPGQTTYITTTGGVVQGQAGPVNGQLFPAVLSIWSGTTNTTVPGTGVIPWDPAFNNATVEFAGLTLADAWVNEGACRIAGIGFEVVNTTPALYVGGTVTTFRVESGRQEFNPGLYGGIATATGLARWPNVAQQNVLFSGYPRNATECYRVPGSRIWNAKDGVYAVGSFDDFSEHFESSDNASLYMATALPINGVSFGMDNTVWGGNINVSAITASQVQSPVVLTHLDMSGAYFSSLQPQSTLQVTLHAYLEITPTTSSVLIDFVKPSTPWEPELLQVFSETMCALPPAVPQGENDAQDFFRKVVQIASPMLSMAFPEFAGPINAFTPLALKGVDALGRAVKEGRKQNSTSANQKALNQLEQLAPERAPTQAPAPRKLRPLPSKKKSSKKKQGSVGDPFGTERRRLIQKLNEVEASIAAL